MIKSTLAALVAVFLSVVTFFAPPAFADAYDVVSAGAGAITGFGPMPMVCGNTSISPVFITNFTSVQQTGSFTINPGLAFEAEAYSSRDDVESSKYATCMPRNPYGSDFNGVAQSQNFTVEPGQTYVAYLGMGGQDYNLDSTSNNIAIGGLPNNTAGASWYDFWLDLGIDLGFKSLTLNYNHTGGPGSGNGQAGFNVVQVISTTNADGTLNYQNTQNILSPYSSRNTNGSANGNWEPVVYGANQPIGLAWIP